MLRTAGLLSASLGAVLVTCCALGQEPAVKRRMPRMALPKPGRILTEERAAPSRGNTERIPVDIRRQADRAGTGPCPTKGGAGQAVGVAR